MKFNCVAIDDDPSSIDLLSDYIESYDKLNLIQSYNDPLRSISALKNVPNFDILFLDIEMPKMNGIELAKLIGHKSDKLIFTSAHVQYTIDAFDLHADAFLLKPFSYSKFLTTVEKVILSIQKNHSNENKTNDFFFIKGKEDKLKLIKVYFNDIIAIESIQNYIAVHTTNKKITAHLTLTKMAETLKEKNNFIQIHRSFIINKDHIEEIDNQILKMNCNLKITIGKNFKENLLPFIKSKTISSF